MSEKTTEKTSEETQKLTTEETSSDKVFYPTGHVIAAFADKEAVELAKAALLKAGFPAEAVITPEPWEMLKQYFAYERDKDANLLEKAKAFVSNMGDESSYVDQYVELASKGYSFLLVYAPEAEDTQRVANIILPLKPERPRKYDRMTVTDLNPATSGI